MTAAENQSTPRGVALDSFGDAVIDPTKNVSDLFESTSRRQDDLRAAAERLTKAEIDHLKEISALRAEYDKELRAAEGKRIDAIRQVDITAVSTAGERAQQAIQALAVTTAANAENLRNALTATATTIATQLANTVAGLTERIAALEKSSYEGVGKQRVADPMIQELVAEMKSVRTLQSAGAGKSAGIGFTGALIVAVIAGVAGLMGIAGVLYAVLK